MSEIKRDILLTPFLKCRDRARYDGEDFEKIEFCLGKQDYVGYNCVEIDITYENRGIRKMKKITRKFVYCLFIVVLFAPAALSRVLAPITPRAAGLSKDHLGEITALMQEHVDNNKLAGAVAVVARRGRVAYLQSIGRQDIEADIDMCTDTIFRIASMTKPITSVAVMMLYEDGLVKLDDPVSKYIPEFKDVTVLAPNQKGKKTVPLEHPVTIKHLLMHTSGLTYHWDRQLGSMYKKANITHGLLPDDSTIEIKMKKLAEIPLLHQPGEAWTYSLSIDVLGRVIEVASGKTLKEFFEQRIFEPLGMDDTHFFIPPEKMSRLAAVYAPKEEGGLKRLGSAPVIEGSLVYRADHPYAGPRNYFSGGGGLCSTIGDYLRFSQMLLNGGTLDGTRVLRPGTIRLMTKDHVGELKKDQGFGLGFYVIRKSSEADGLDCVGSFGWGGFWYTTFFVDPDKKLIGICMSQIHPDGDATLNKEFKRLVYQAVEN